MISESPYVARPWIRHYDYWVPPDLSFPCRPLAQILDDAVVDVPDRPATAFLGAHLTFRDIKRQSDRFATWLAQNGVGRGDRVGIMLPNCPQYIVAAFAVLRLGAIVVNVNPLYTPREFLGLAGDSGMRLVITLDKLAPLVLAVRGQTAIERIVITSLPEYSIAAAPPARVEGTLAMADLIAGVTTVAWPRVAIDPEQDLAVLQYTGGTTGTPKAAMLTHYNVFANVVQVERWHHRALLRGEDRTLMVIPYFHVYGFTVGLMMGVWTGAQQIMIPKYEVEPVLQAIRDYQPTFFPAVPTIYVSLLNHPRMAEYALGGVRIFNSGAAPLPIEVLEQFEQKTGRTLHEGYGLSEASPVTHSTPRLSRRKPGTIGLPLPGTETKIVDVETGTREMPVGQAGELCVAGPQVMKGYWNSPEETSKALRTDSAGRVWLFTGDVATMDADGFFSIIQRKKDLILVDGFNVYPSEVEGLLYGHAAVREAAVIGAPDAYHGEVVRAFVVLKPGTTATAAELKAHCAAGLAAFKVPDRIEIRESLPMSAVGKILYRALREELRQE
jgi:long-chain acyl-CoA synthetase